MMLLTLLALLVVSFAITKFVLNFNSGRTSTEIAFRIGLTVFFVFTGVGHFLKTQEMSLMLGPDFSHAILAIQITGILELLGAIGIWPPRWRKVIGYCLVAMMIVFLPFNIFAAVDRVPFGGHEFGPIYLLIRVPFQFLVIWWIGKALGTPVSKPIRTCRWFLCAGSETGVPALPKAVLHMVSTRNEL